MQRGRRLELPPVGGLPVLDALPVDVGHVGVGAQGEPGGLKDLFGVGDGVLKGGGGGVGGAAAGAALLSEGLDDVAVEPDAVELGVGHVAGARDATAAGGRVAEAVEGLGHGPLGGGVEELAVSRGVSMTSGWR